MHIFFSIKNYKIDLIVKEEYEEKKEIMSLNHFTHKKLTTNIY